MAGVRGGQHPPRATPGRKGRPCNPTLGFPLAAGTAGDAAGAGCWSSAPSLRLVRALCKTSAPCGTPNALPHGCFPPNFVSVRSYQGAGVSLGEDVAQEDPQVRRPRLQLGQVLEEGVALQDPGEKAAVRQGRNRILQIIPTPQLSAAFNPISHPDGTTGRPWSSTAGSTGDIPIPKVGEVTAGAG